MNKKWIGAMLLVGYTALLFKVLVLKDLPMIRIGHLMLNFGGTQAGEGNLIPFKTILPYLMGKMGLLIGGINILGNIALLIPIGYLLPFVFHRLTTKKALIIALAFCLLIECIQAILKIGIFDIDDVILNGLGFMIGYWFYRWIPAIWMYLIKNKFAMMIVLGMIGTVIYLCIHFILDLQKPIGPGPGELNHHERNEGRQKQHSAEDPKDLCGGTGGTGAISKLEKDHFVLKRRDGKEEVIYFTNETKILTSKGAIEKSELKTGTRATIVTGPDVDGRKTAEAVLVCMIIQ